MPADPPALTNATTDAESGTTGLTGAAERDATRMALEKMYKKGLLSTAEYEAALRDSPAG